MSTFTKPKVLFVLSVDTEEEWDWRTPFPQENICVNNTLALPEFQQFCMKLGIRPTYFIDYAVAKNEISVDAIKKVIESNMCEVGAHLHPWCTPPLTVANGEFESHVVNLPIKLVEEKLVTLLEQLKQSFGKPINSFRTGRWGINAEVLQLLTKYGITIDSSVYPYYQNDFFSCEGAPTKPYWPNLSNPLLEGGQSKIFELPVSAGFNNKFFELSNKIHQCIVKKPFSLLHISGVLWHLNLLKKLYLSPELTSLDNMISLMKAQLKRNSSVIHMNLHSSSLIHLPYSNHPYSKENIYKNLTGAVKYLNQNAEVTFCTITEAAEKYNVRNSR